VVAGQIQRAGTVSGRTYDGLMRSRVSASAIGTRTQLSRTTAYLGTSGIVLPGAALAGSLQGGGVVFGAAAVDAS
jgi:hypothetical protein